MCGMFCFQDTVQTCVRGFVFNIHFTWLCSFQESIQTFMCHLCVFSFCLAGNYWEVQHQRAPHQEQSPDGERQRPRECGRVLQHAVVADNRGRRMRETERKGPVQVLLSPKMECGCSSVSGELKNGDIHKCHPETVYLLWTHCRKRTLLIDCMLHWYWYTWC